MKKNLVIILISALASSGLHLYLSSRAQMILAGDWKPSPICHINEKLNCDTALASNWSKIGGIFLSDAGFGLNAVMAVSAMALLMSPAAELRALWLVLLAFSPLSAFSSLFLLGVSSLILNSYCPFCLLLYGLSFLILICVTPLFFKKTFLKDLFKNHFRFKTIAGALGSFAVLTILCHLVFSHIGGGKSAEQRAKLYFKDWLSAPKKDLQNLPSPLLAFGQKNNSITITEFADFLCPHCRDSHYTIKLLKSSDPNISVQYYSFPLDQCRPKNSPSCFLTRAVFCAKDQGWLLKDLIFKTQKKFKSLRTEEELYNKLKELSADPALDPSQWSQCLNSETAFQKQAEQVLAGEKAGITGTPSLFINGKKINSRQFFQTLKEIKKYLKSAI